MKYITEGQFQWFIDIVSYLQLVTGETMYIEELQRNKVHAAEVQKRSNILLSMPIKPMCLCY